MSTRSKILVTLQFLCFLYFLIWGNILAFGWLILFQLLAIGLGIWSVVVMRIGNFNIQPEVKTKAVFVTSGPYGLIRNPMYAALLFFFGAGVINSFQWMNLIVFLVLLVVFLLKITMEEQFLTVKFGDKYLLYKSKTYRLVPFVF